MLEAKVTQATVKRPQLKAWIAFASNEVNSGLPLANESEFIAADEHLSRQWARIVIGCHYKSISARAHDRRQIALFHLGQLALLREEIAALAHWPDHIDHFVRRILRLSHGNDLVITLVQRWPDQIVHAGIDDKEFLVLCLLPMANAREQNTGVSD